MTDTLLNGIDRQALMETIDAFGDDPSLAAFTFRVRNRWSGGGESTTVIDDYFGVCEERSREEPFRILSDEPGVLLGSDGAPNAVEYLLHAMASCVNATFMNMATVQGFSVSAVQIRISGDLDLRGWLGLDEGVRSGFSSVDVEMTVRSNAPTDTAESLCALALKRSPVFDIVAHGLPVTVSARAEYIPTQSS